MKRGSEIVVKGDKEELDNLASFLNEKKIPFSYSIQRDSEDSHPGVLKNVLADIAQSFGYIVVSLLTKEAMEAMYGWCKRKKSQDSQNPYVVVTINGKVRELDEETVEYLQERLQKITRKPRSKKRSKKKR